MTYTTVTVEMPRKKIAELYRFCADRLITVDELAEQLFARVVQNPDEAKKWIEEARNEEYETQD